MIQCTIHVGIYYLKKKILQNDQNGCSEKKIPNLLLQRRFHVSIISFDMTTLNNHWALKNFYLPFNLTPSEGLLQVTY